MGKRLILLGLTIVGVADLMSCGRPAGLEGELVLEEGQPGDARGSLVRLYVEGQVLDLDKIYMAPVLSVTVMGEVADLGYSVRYLLRR